MEAFQRIQQKLYGLDGTGCRRDSPAPPIGEAGLPAVPPPEADPQPSAAADLSVWDFFPRLDVRVLQTFRDYDGQEVRAGEVLHFIEGSYFFYEGGHTLRFAEKTIRLADVVEEHRPIIANTGNAWFQPLGVDRASRRLKGRPTRVFAALVLCYLLLNTRPVSVTVIGCIFVAAGTSGLIYHLPDFSLWVSLVRLIAIVCGVYMLRGHNWARWAALAWIAYHVILSAFHSMFELAVHALLCAAFAYFLLRPRATRYFRAAGA